VVAGGEGEGGHADCGVGEEEVGGCGEGEGEEEEGEEGVIGAHGGGFVWDGDGWMFLLLLMEEEEEEKEEGGLTALLYTGTSPSSINGRPCEAVEGSNASQPLLRAVLPTSKHTSESMEVG